MPVSQYQHVSAIHPTLDAIHDIALEWVNQKLTQWGMPHVSRLESVHNMAWSVVAKVHHQQGTWYFKALTPHIAYELDVTNTLANTFPSEVGNVIAYDMKKRFILLADLGTNLFDYQPPSASYELWKQALSNYATLQIKTATLGKPLFPTLPDRTLELIPFEALPIIERCVDIAPRDGGKAITESDVEWIKSKFNNWADTLEEIRSLPIPNSIHHGDLHGGNIAMHTKPTVFDWGDSSWSHPFVTFYISADACIHHFGRHDQDTYRELQEAYLTPWLAYGSMDQLTDILEKVNKISPLVMLLSWAYAISNKADSRSLEWESGLCTWVNEYIKLNQT